jgi:hypothetical protein
VRPRRRLWWSLYAACAVAVVVALGWISRTALDLERSEAQARVEVGHEQLVREALWRMDSWLAPLLAAEAARAVEEYTPIRYLGGLGAFTTFSAVMVELLDLWRERRRDAIVYLAATFIGGIGLAWLGLSLA